jgi:predicted nucleic acid-binding protein
VILVDTSVWIDHLRSASSTLIAALEREEVIGHPFVIGELACGTLRSRDEVLALLAALPQASVATDEEVLLFIDRHRLMGRGIGHLDAHLLASATLTEETQLWTHDKRLRAVAADLRLAFAT